MSSQSKSQPDSPSQAQKSSRRMGREMVLQGLFESEFSTDSTNHIESVNSLKRDSQSPSQESLGFATELLKGVLSKINELDNFINGFSDNWTVQRMSIVDRNILRIAMYELKFLSGAIPPKVAINEAIEIAKVYSSQESSRFINGILDQAVKRL